MDREIRIRISKDGKVEVDSTIFNDCKEVADFLANHLGKVESFMEKDDLDTAVRIKIEQES